MPVSAATRLINAMRYDVAGQIAVQAAGLGTGIVLARSLGPELFGQLALVLAIASTGALLANFGGTEIATRYVPELKAKGRLSNVFGLAWPVISVRLALSLFVAAAIISLRGPIGDAIGLEENLTMVLAALAASHALLAGIQGPAQVALVNLDRQRLVNAVNGATNGAGFAVVLALAMAGTLTVQLAVAVIVISLAIRVITYVMVVARSLSNMPETKAGDLKYEAELRRRMFRYGGVMLLIGIGGFLLQTRSDQYLVGAILGVQAVAFYHLANGFSRAAFTLPASRLTGFLMTGMLTEAYVSEGMDSLRNRFRQLVRVRFLFSVPIGFGGAVLATDIVDTVYGPEYGPAAGLLALFFLLQMPLYWIGSISGVLVAIEKPHWFLWTKGVALLTIPLAIWWIALWGLEGALFATTLGTAAVAALEFFAARLHTGISFPFTDVLRYFGAGAVMAVVVGGVVAIGGPSWVSLLVGVPVGIVIYGVALLALKAFSPAELNALSAAVPLPFHRLRPTPASE